jgi:hypothetical protein
MTYSPYRGVNRFCGAGRYKILRKNNEFEESLKVV